MKNLKKVAPWLLIAAPFVYLGIIWKDLPGQVPTHFTAKGPDDWSDKNMLIFIPAMMPLGIFLLMSLIPVIDPKKKIAQMGDKFAIFRLILTFFFSVLACYILFITEAGKWEKPQMMYAIIGALFAAMGNYFQTVRPNYFIGIRTPWTLEDEEIWKSTHLLAGRIWMAGGLMVIVLAFLVSNTVMDGLMTGIIVVMGLIPVIHSFLAFQKKKRLIREK